MVDPSLLEVEIAKTFFYLLPVLIVSHFIPAKPIGIFYPPTMTLKSTGECLISKYIISLYFCQCVITIITQTSTYM